MNETPSLPFTVLAVVATLFVLWFARRGRNSTGATNPRRGLVVLAMFPLTFGLLGALVGHVAKLHWVVQLGPAFESIDSSQVTVWKLVPLVTGAVGTALCTAVALLGGHRQA